jgi:hypothetical protein
MKQTLWLASPLIVIGLFAFVGQLIGGSTASPLPSPATFVPGCTLPFENIKGKNLTIDAQCGKDGASAANSASGKQNEAKNNFCATGTPVGLTFGSFDQLQATATQNQIPFGGSNSLPTDRSVLKNLININGKSVGEGSVVSLTGVVFDARHSNTTFFNETGESVNCNTGTLDMNDIHIELAESAGQLNSQDECNTVTAEISPHFRPTSWDRFDVNPKTSAAARGLPLKAAIVRVTGQLFFDASHGPCVNGQGSAPRRRSIWEIHPVYAIEVFDTTKNKFIALDQWAKGK